MSKFYLVSREIDIEAVKYRISQSRETHIELTICFLKYMVKFHFDHE